jgi:hypothetical protein
MTAMRSIWDGPFFIGKLTQPVSIGDVLLKTLEVLWRVAITLIGLAIVTGTALMAYAYIIGPVFFPPIEDSIVANAFYAADLQEPPPMVPTIPLGGKPSLPTMDELKKEPCTEEFPVRVSLFNNGSSTISSVSLRLEGYTPGFSTNYVENWNFTDEHILRPGEGWSGCYGVRTKDNVQPSKLKYKIEIWSASEI